GSRASTANIAAELLGIDYSRINVLIGDTNSIGFSNLTGGSRVTFAPAMVVTQSAEKVIKQLCSRAAKIWKIDEEAVTWDNGRALHPDYVEGQLQGAMAQAIGWALTEEYIYNKRGQVDNPGFLDYRMPVASDLPMLECGIIEIPNPKHPQGVKGVGEVPLVPG